MLIWFLFAIYLIVSGYFVLHGNSIGVLTAALVAIPVIYFLFRVGGASTVYSQNVTDRAPTAGGRLAGRIRFFRWLGIALCVGGAAYGFTAMRFEDMSTNVGAIMSIGIAGFAEALGCGCFIYIRALRIFGC